MGKLVLGMALAIAALAQTAAPPKQHFFIRIEPTRPTFSQDATKEENKIVAEHFSYLKKLAGEGTVVLAGPSINGAKTFGAIIVEVENEAAAKAILAADPAYKAGIWRGEVLPFVVSLQREAKPAK
jgi:uncharacterized protein